RHPPDAGRARRRRSHDGRRHRRLRRAAAHGRAGRTRLPDRELLAPADPRRRRLSAAQAAPKCHRPRETRDTPVAPGPVPIARANITRAAIAFTVTKSWGELCGKRQTAAPQPDTERRHGLSEKPGPGIGNHVMLKSTSDYLILLGVLAII